MKIVQEDLQRLRELRPIDDDFMRYMFKDNIPLAELVLRIITDRQDLTITGCETQKDMKRLAGARSTCLDAYGTDSVGKRYDLELQRQEKGAGLHRARYHSSVLDKRRCRPYDSILCHSFLSVPWNCSSSLFGISPCSFSIN